VISNAAKGFTLIELLFGLGVLVILLAIGIPSFQELTARHQITNATNELLASLQLARTDSVKQMRDVSLCPSTSGSGCTGGTSWSDGWIVFRDPNANAAVDEGEVVLVVAQPLVQTLSLSGPETIRYRPSGAVDTLPTPFDIAQSGEDQERCISVTASGSASSRYGACQ
jgi:type IV fimbrial biogenesis protein FimT